MKKAAEKNKILLRKQFAALSPVPRKPVRLQFRLGPPAN